MTLRSEHPVVTPTLRFRELEKLSSGYIIPFLEAVDLQSGRIHTTFDSTGLWVRRGKGEGRGEGREMEGGLHTAIAFHGARTCR